MIWEPYVRVITLHVVCFDEHSCTCPPDFLCTCILHLRPEWRGLPGRDVSTTPLEKMGSGGGGREGGNTNISHYISHYITSHTTCVYMWNVRWTKSL